MAPSMRSDTESKLVAAIVQLGSTVTDLELDFCCELHSGTWSSSASLVPFLSGVFFLELFLSAVLTSGIGVVTAVDATSAYLRELGAGVPHLVV